MATDEETVHKRNQLLRYSKWLAAVTYILAVLLAAVNYRQPLFWLWFAVILVSIGWFATILLWTRQGRI